MLFSRLQLAIAGAVIALLLVALAVQTIRIDGILWIDGIREKLERCQAKVKSADEAARRQKQATAINVSRARETMKQVEGPAKRVESAPLPGGCRTPEVIMGADL